MLKTWDIFDTLIARRCIAPHAIFQIMEQRAKSSGFTQARMVAERNLIARWMNHEISDFNIDDIYNEIERITNADKKICQTFKNFECEVELEQCIPITENILQVKSGDILISDMYLPEDFLRKMLQKCGLLVPVEIVVSAGGKSSGRAWQQLAAQNHFLFHIGDNEVSDIKNPRDFGFDSALTIVSQPNEVEKFLLQKDFNFAAYLREIRLRNPYSEEIKRQYWQFFTWNVGILIILVQLIDQLQKKCGFEYLGFCGRDTYYLWLLYRKFKEDKKEIAPPNDYLHYSRKLVFNYGSEMAKYFTAKMNNRKALMIDLTGTGFTFNLLRSKMQKKFSVLMCSLYDKTKIGNWIQFTGQENFSYRENQDFYFGHIHSDILEFFNRATHNTPIKLTALQICDRITPEVIFSEVSDTEDFGIFETCLQEILKSQVTWGGGGVNAIENLNQMLEIMKKLATPYTFSARHKINEVMDIRTTFKLNK